MAQDTQRHGSGDPSMVPSGTYDPDAMPEAVESLDPTRDLYEDLNLAFRFFNERLFSNALKPSLITLRATGRTHGYFSPGRFVDTRTGVKVNEIAFNPEDFARRGVEDVLSTLVHETASRRTSPRSRQEPWSAGFAQQPELGYTRRNFRRKTKSVS